MRVISPFCLRAGTSQPEGTPRSRAVLSELREGRGSQWKRPTWTAVGATHISHWSLPTSEVRTGLSQNHGTCPLCSYRAFPAFADLKTNPFQLCFPSRWAPGTSCAALYPPVKTSLVIPPSFWSESAACGGEPQEGCAWKHPWVTAQRGLSRELCTRSFLLKLAVQTPGTRCTPRSRLARAEAKVGKAAGSPPAWGQRVAGKSGRKGANLPPTLRRSCSEEWS